MTASHGSANPPSPDAALRPRVPVALFAVSVAVIITNVFAPQTLVGLIVRDFSLTPAASGLSAMMPLVGYAAGLFFLVPLADLAENRRLVLKMLACGALAAAGISVAPNVPVLFALSFALGAASSAIQVLVPAAAAMAAPEERGRVIGDVMSGLMVGILLSRPIASFLAEAWGWKGFYVASAVALAALAFLLAARLPERRPVQPARYGALIGSLWHLLLQEPVLRQRAITAAIVMAAFNLFWTSIVYVLGAEPFHLGQGGIAIFALAGAGGAIFTPFFGRFADKGWSRHVTMAAHLVLMVGFGVAAWAGTAPLGVAAPLLLGGLVVSAVLLDFGVLGDQTIGRYLINQLRPEARGRINAIFVGVFFVGGAAGSAASGLLWSLGGWSAICAGGALLGALAFRAHRRTTPA